MNTRGFTLIELIVVIAIILIFAGRSLVAVKDFGDRQNISNESLHIVEYLRQAQLRASAVEVGSCTSKMGGVQVNMSGKKMTMTSVCTNGDVRELNLTKASFCNNQQITFLVPMGDLENAVDVYVCRDGVTKYKIEILKNGSIAEPLVSNGT